MGHLQPMHPPHLKYRAIVHYTHFLRSLRKVATLYNIGKSTLARWIKTADGPVQKRRSRANLCARIASIVAEAVRRRPFSTADQIIVAVREALGKEVSRSTVYRALRATKHSYKRASRGREHEPVPLEHPFMKRDSYEGDPIAVDESSFYWNDVPRMGWGPKGKRVMKARPSHRTRVSLILAVSKDAVIGHTVLVGGVNAKRFADFVRTLPDNRPLILDNCSIHKTKEVRSLVEAKGMELRFIPPYCPWYNPAEFCFSEVKRAYRPLRLHSPAADFVDDVRTCLVGLRHQAAYFLHAKTMCDRDRGAPKP
jgi:transposase